MPVRYFMGQVIDIHINSTIIINTTPKAIMAYLFSFKNIITRFINHLIQRVYHTDRVSSIDVMRSL